MNIFGKRVSSSTVLGSVFLLFLSICLIYSFGGTSNSVDFHSKELPISGFVGDQSCQTCHSEQFSGWEGSHHDYAMKEATESYVLGNFDDVTFTHRESSTASSSKTRCT